MRRSYITIILISLLFLFIFLIITHSISPLNTSSNRKDWRMMSQQPYIYPHSLILSKGDEGVLEFGIYNKYPLNLFYISNISPSYASIDVLNNYSCGYFICSDLEIEMLNYIHYKSASSLINSDDYLISDIYLDIPESAIEGQYFYIISICSSKSYFNTFEQCLSNNYSTFSMIFSFLVE